MIIMEHLLYSREHEWIRVEGEKAYIGITDFAQFNLGDIVFVELPELDTEVSAYDEMGVIESVKAVASVYSPVMGIVAEVNNELEDCPEALNEAPYENWIAVVNMNNPDDLKELMGPKEYEEYCIEQQKEMEAME